MNFYGVVNEGTKDEWFIFTPIKENKIRAVRIFDFDGYESWCKAYQVLKN